MSSPEVIVLDSIPSNRPKRSKKRKGRPKDDRNYEYRDDHINASPDLKSKECKACTFHNAPTAMTCEICGNAVGQVMIDLTEDDDQHDSTQSPTLHHPTARGLRTGKRCMTAACREDYQLAKICQMQEEEEAKMEKEARKEQELCSMLASSTGKAVRFIGEVIKLQAKLDPEFQKIRQGYLKTVAVDDMVNLAEKMIQLQEEFRSKGVDTTVTIAYHYTKSQNMEGIRKDGLMSGSERQTNNVKFVRGGGAMYGNGIYTGRNPFSFQVYGDVGLLVAIMKGKVKYWQASDPTATGANTVIGNKVIGNDRGATGSTHANDEVILKQSAQCLPLISFSTSMLLGQTDVTASPAGQLIWRYHQELQYLVDEFLNGGDEVEPEIVLAHPFLGSAAPPIPRIPRPAQLKVAPAVVSLSASTRTMAPAKPPSSRTKHKRAGKSASGLNRTPPPMSVAPLPTSSIPTPNQKLPPPPAVSLSTSVRKTASGKPPSSRTKYKRACKIGSKLNQKPPPQPVASPPMPSQNLLPLSVSIGSMAPAIRTKYARACKNSATASIPTASATTTSTGHRKQRLASPRTQYVRTEYPRAYKKSATASIPIALAATTSTGHKKQRLASPRTKYARACKTASVTNSASVHSFCR